MNNKASEKQNKTVEKRDPEQKRDRKITLRRAALILLCVVLLLILIKLMFPKVLDADRAVRFFRYMGLRDKESYGHVSFDANSSNAYAGFDGGIMVGSESGVTLLNMEGEQKALIQGALPAPVVRSGNEIALCFSPGSSFYTVIGKGGKTLIEKAVSGSFLDAAVSEDGFLCCLTSESGYKAVATVMNQKQETVFKFSSRTHYLNTCAISEGGSRLAVSTLGETQSIYHSGITILRTDEAITDLDAESSSAVKVDLGNEIVYHLEFLDKTHLCAIGQKNVTFLNVEGKILKTFSVTDQTLSDYAVGKGFLMLCLKMDGSGSRYRVLTLDTDGDVIGERVLNEKIRSVSAAGSYTAVLTDLRLEILDKRLASYESMELSRTAVQVIVREDGTALCVSTNSAELFIP